MAKAKKQALTPEECLKHALIPESEQPYAVPENWTWTKLSSLVDLHRGVSYPKDAAHSEKAENDCLVMRGGNIDEGGLTFKDNIYVDSSLIKTSQLVQKHDIIVVSSTGSTKVIGKAGVSEANYPDVAFGAFLTLVRPREDLDKKLISLFFQTEGYRNAIRTLAKGVNINNIKNEYIQNILFPLPPLPEQRRIVERIEGMFEKLDRAKELAQNALDSFETRKAAILHKAFTGELTAHWREQNGVAKESWKERPFSAAAEIKSNLVNPKEYPDFPHIAPDNIEKRTGILLEYNTIAQDGVTSGKHRFYAGQILYSKIRPYLSKVIIVDFDGLCSADMYPIEAKDDSKYLWYYMLSDDFLEQASNAGSRSVLPKINQKELSTLTVPVPSLPEQQEIVRILDGLFVKEQRARELCDVIDKIDLIKKAILARAFRGELGTNDPSEESAVELLREIIQ